MQATKNGLKSALRTPGKTLLFLLILTVTAALLTVSCCVYGAVRGYLNNCEDFFHTIAELEYIGEYYPNSVVYDESFAEAVEQNRATLAALIDAEPVLNWEPASAELMLSPQIHRWDETVPAPDAAVLRVKIYGYDDAMGLYTALVTETLYSRIDYNEQLILIRGIDGAERLRYPVSYLIAGTFYSNAFQLAPAEFRYDGELIQLPPLLPEGASEEEEAPFRLCADALHRINDSCRVSYSTNVEDLYPFHQQIITLLHGRFFTQEEYDAKARVCIVSERITGLLGLELGDPLPFTLYRAEGDLNDVSSHVPIDEEPYTIVGIVSHSDDYPYCVFLPDANVGREIRPVNGYTLGQFRLKNNQVPAFQEAAAPLLEQGFRLNIYDQGYAAATEPMEELLFISGIFLAVCLLLAACALAMQSHLFISRQREAARTMYAMGSGKVHVVVYFLSAALALTIPAAVFGAALGKLAERQVFEILQRFASQFAEQDLRFSATRLAISRTLEFNPASAFRSYLIAAAILAGGTLAFTLAFALFSMRQQKTAKKKTVRQTAPKRNGRVSRLSGFFKYGLLSLGRGRGRTVAVLLMGLAAAMFFGQLSSSLISYEEQLAAYRENAVISGSATDYYAKRINGLSIRGRAVSLLSGSDLLEDYCATIRFGHIKILGVEGKEQLPFDWPQYGSNAYTTVFYMLSKEPLWSGTTSVSESPLFHFSDSGSVTWLKGWSEADFTRLDRVGSTMSGPAVCALPQAMMEEYGIQLGDTINTAVAYYFPPYWDEVVTSQQLQVVASYLAPVESSTVYSPATFVRKGLAEQNYFPIINGSESDYLMGRDFFSAEELAQFQANGVSPLIDYSSFTFTLKDSLQLDDLRTVMEEDGFTWVHSGERIKPFALIQDDVYLNTVHSMERQIQYVRVLYAALYLLAGIIGFALAWLLLLSRRKEIAVMRALGTQPGRILGNFLLEQFLLMVLGLSLGMLASRLSGTPLNHSQKLLTAAFLSIWTLSTLICLISGLQKKSFAALTEPE